MTERRAIRESKKTRSLEQAASLVFVLTTVLPLLIFVWILHSVDAMKSLHAQLGIVLSLVIAMLGFAILRTLMRRTSEALQMLVRATPHVTPHRAVPAAAPQRATPQPAAPAPAAAGGVPAPTKENGSARPRLTPETFVGATPAAQEAEDEAESAPAIGSIQELRDAAMAVARQWRREAEPLVGQPVRVYATNFGEPERGILARVTDDGLVLETDGNEFGVLWRLVSAIEADAGADAPGPAVAQPT